MKSQGFRAKSKDGIKRLPIASLFTFHPLHAASIDIIPLVKLVVCVVHSRDRGRVSDELVRAGFKSTIIGTTGGFLREGNTTFLIGIEDSEWKLLQDVVSANSSTREQVVNVASFEAGPQGAFVPNPVKVPVGGAVMFVMNVEQFVRY